MIAEEPQAEGIKDRAQGAPGALSPWDLLDGTPKRAPTFKE
jgi:hypothetical protein